MHFIVDQFVNTDTELEAILTTLSKGKDSLVEAMRLFFKSNADNEYLPAALKKADAIKLTEYEPNLRAIFLMLWSETSEAFGRKDEARYLIKKALSLNNKEMPPIILSYLNLSSRQNETLLKHKQFIKSELKKFSKSSPRYSHFIYRLMLYEATEGLLKEDISYYLKLFAKSKSITTLRLKSIVMINEIQQFNIPAAVSIRSIFDQEKHKRFSFLVDIWDPSIELLMRKGNSHFNEANLNSNLKSKLLASRELFRDNPTEALKIIRMAPFNYKTHTHFFHFLIYSELRVELSNHNVAQATEMLNHFFRHNDNPLLDFFQARIYIQKSDLKEATISFSRCLDAVAQYGLENRLALEIDLSPEINTSILMKLSNGAAKISSNKKKITKAPEKKISINSPKGIKRIFGSSSETNDLRDSILQLCNIDTLLLITGETGVGKDVTAKAIHEESKRGDHPYLAINCAAITDTLLQSELFGHAAGAYTGAAKAHKGILETAGQGTVLLDEIGDISPKLQIALLRVLESSEYRPVGSANPKKYKCRIIAATNVNLLDKIKSGEFRKDLFYRLKRFQINILPLRERLSDLPELLNYFFNERSPFNSTQIKASDSLIIKAQGYHWPGNIRELHNEIEKLVILNPDKTYFDESDLDIGGLALEDNELSSVTPTIHKTDTTPTDIFSEDLKKADRIIGSIKKKDLRLKRIRLLFKNHKKITRAEIMKIIETSSRTATADLRELISTGLIEKVEPTSSPRSHYFIRKT